RALRRGLERRARFRARHAALLVAQLDGQRRARAAVDADRHGPDEARAFAFEALAQLLVQRGVGGLVEDVAGRDAARVDRAAQEAEQRAVALCIDGNDTSAFLRLVGPSPVQHYAVAGLERRLELGEDAVALDGGD